MPPHIAIDVRMARDSGIGTYIRNLVPLVTAGRPTWRFTLLGRTRDVQEIGLDRSPNVAIRECSARTYTLREQVELRRRAPADADLFWSPHYNIPLAWRGRLMVTVHDVFHLAMPQFVPGRLKRIYARSMFAAVDRKASAVITVSSFSRDEYATHVGTRRAPVVVYNGVHDSWRTTTPPPARGTATGRDPYILFVGNIKPHKNLRTLVRAFGSLLPEIPHELLIVGRREGLRGPDERVVTDVAALGHRARFMGEVDDRTLRSYVAGADALVAPSLYEGFGLPPLEAMALGCPTLVSRAASFPEICGNAASYCDPLDSDDMARALRALLLDDCLRRELRARGPERAAEFTWARSAEQTLAVLESALEHR